MKNLKIIVAFASTITAGPIYLALGTFGAGKKIYNSIQNYMGANINDNLDNKIQSFSATTGAVFAFAISNIFNGRFPYSGFQLAMSSFPVLPHVAKPFVTKDNKEKLETIAGITGIVVNILAGIYLSGTLTPEVFFAPLTTLEALFG